MSIERQRDSASWSAHGKLVIQAQRRLNACAIVMISISFMEMLAEFSRTQPWFMITKPRAADMPSTWSITAKQRNSFQIVQLSLIYSTLLQWSSWAGMFDLHCLLKHNTCKHWIEVCLELISFRRLLLAWLRDKEKKNEDKSWGNHRLCFHSRVSRPLDIFWIWSPCYLVFNSWSMIATPVNLRSMQHIQKRHIHKSMLSCKPQKRMGCELFEFKWWKPEECNKVSYLLYLS